MPATCILRASAPASKKLSIATWTPSASSLILVSPKLYPLSCRTLTSRCSNSTRSFPCILRAPLRRTHSMTRGHTTHTRRATSSTRFAYPSWRSTRTTTRSLTGLRKIMTGTSGSRSLSRAEAVTWAGSSLVGRRIAGPGAPCSSGSGPRESTYVWKAEKQGRLSAETAGW